MSPVLPEAALNPEAFEPVYQAGSDAVYSLIRELVQLIVDQSRQSEEISARLKALGDRSSKNSHNSGKPPSSDGFGRKPKSLRKTTGRNPGGQPGHEGKTLEMSETPDEIVVHAVDACPECGEDLRAVAPEIVDRRQVFDLPPLRLEVTEHQLGSRTCPCCRRSSRGLYPEAVAQPVQYGPGIRGLGVYLQVHQLLPYDRTAELLRTVFGAAPSQGTLARAIKECAKGLKPIEEKIRGALEGAAVVHCDETGSRVEGKLWWLHSASTSVLTLYQIHRKRGQEAMSTLGLLDRLRGRAVHDCWASYFKFECLHALCNAHHLRELTYLEERFHLGWAARMKSVLVEGHEAVQAAKALGEKTLEASVLQMFETRYTTLLEEGFALDLQSRSSSAAESSPEGSPKKKGRRKQSPAKNLLDRLSRYREETLAFLHDFAIPFDNNQAERDIRMTKIQQKISGGFRSEDGAVAFFRIRGYVSTLRKQGLPVLNALRDVFLGSPLLPSFNP